MALRKHLLFLFAAACVFLHGPSSLSVAQPEEGNGRQANEERLWSSNPDDPVTRRTRRQPHIVFVFVDDMGFSDVSWNYARLPDSEKPRGDMTPTLTKLAREGIILSQAYSLHMCTPSRASVLTGRHPVTFGFHDSIHRPDRAYGLPINQRLVSQDLKQLGYATHIIGEWHLGFCNTSYMPTSRGFDTSLIHVTGRMSYFDHTYYWQPKYPKPSYVLHDGLNPLRNTSGTYSTFLFARRARQLIAEHNKTKPMFLFLPLTAPHTPLEAPAKWRARARTLFPQGTTTNRLDYAAVLLAMDHGIKIVVDALKRHNMWNDTVFAFASDNGPNPKFGASYPLRGAKGTFLEGGMRVPAFVHGQVFPRKGIIEDIIFHVSDWYPTFVYLAGGKPKSGNVLEGMNLAPRLLATQSNLATVDRRQEMLYHFDVQKLDKNLCQRGMSNKCCLSGRLSGAYRYGRMKIIVVHSEKALSRTWWWYQAKPTWIPPWLRGIRSQLILQYLRLSWLKKLPDGNFWGLFDLKEDPNEEVNLVDRRPVYFRFLRSKLLRHCALARQPSLSDIYGRTAVERANPKYHNNFWTHGWC